MTNTWKKLAMCFGSTMVAGVGIGGAKAAMDIESDGLSAGVFVFCGVIATVGVVLAFGAMCLLLERLGDWSNGKVGGREGPGTDSETTDMLDRVMKIIIEKRKPFLEIVREERSGDSWALRVMNAMTELHNTISDLRHAETTAGGDE